MKVIEPSKISGEIMDLIETAQKHIIIISPYNEISEWNKLKNKIIKAQSRGVNITWYSRLNVKEKFPNEIWNVFKIKPILIESLHAKIYLNEKDAVVTSMNLNKTSDDNSTDIGIKTENSKEYSDVYKFYETYIKSKAENIPNLVNGKTHFEKDNNKYGTINISKFNYINLLYTYLIQKLGKIDYNLEYVPSPQDMRSGPIKGVRHFNVSFSEYSILFIPSGYKSVRIILRWQKIRNLKSVEVSLYKSFVNKLSAGNEFDIRKEEGYIKYKYISNFEINSWDEKRISYFLSEVDILIELLFRIEKDLAQGNQTNLS